MGFLLTIAFSQQLICNLHIFGWRIQKVLYTWLFLRWFYFCEFRNAVLAKIQLQYMAIYKFNSIQFNSMHFIFFIIKKTQYKTYQTYSQTKILEKEKGDYEKRELEECGPRNIVEKFKKIQNNYVNYTCIKQNYIQKHELYLRATHTHTHTHAIIV